MLMKICGCDLMNDSSGKRPSKLPPGWYEKEGRYIDYENAPLYERPLGPYRE